jgi:hypothetical protein
MKRLRGRLTYANVIATLALFIALGGASYAAVKLPRNSVGAKQLKKGAVTPAKLAVASTKALTGPAGPAGPAGPQGPVGLQGPKGDPATSILAHVSETGKLISGSGGVKGSELVEKAYEVKFNRDIRGCNFQFTPDRGGGEPVVGFVEPEDDPTSVVLEPVGTGESPLRTGFTTHGFYLAVFCP